MTHRYRTTLVALVVSLSLHAPAVAGSGDTSWMLKAKYGIFLHYQHRILLGYSSGTAALGTKPKLPPVAEMTAEGWNRFVDGFDVRGFADQMAEGKVGWVLFCIDDHYFGWPCAPNKTFDQYTGYAAGEKCSRRDLIAELADALNRRGVKLICYYAGLNGCMQDSKASAGLMDDGDAATPPSAECRKRRIEVLKEYADRYKDRVAGWWFDGVMPDSYRERPHDWWTIESVVHSANPKGVIAFSWGRNRQACICKGVDDFTSGDSYKKQDLTRLTPKGMPAQGGILWHGKIYCGNVYHGQGDANQYSDQELIDWINTCNRHGGVCTLDWPFDPNTGLLKDFGITQLKRISHAVKGLPAPQPWQATEGEWSPPPAQDLFARLRPRPRLLVTAEDMARLKQRAQDDADLSEAFALMRKEADRVIDARRAYAGILRSSRDVKVLLWAWRMTGQKDYARRTWEILDEGRRVVGEQIANNGGFKGSTDLQFLYVSELVQAMALAYDWCHEAWSTEQRGSIRRAIVELSLRPGLAIIQGKRRHKNGWLWYEDERSVQNFWYRSSNNWNATCSAGLVMGALAVADEMPELSGPVLEGALAGFAGYARAFAPDGGSSEGPGYLGGGMSDAVWLLASLETALGSDFGLSSFPGFGSTGEFLLHVTSPTGQYFAFGDSPLEVRRWPYLFWLARRFNRPDYAWYARQGAGLAPDFGWFDGDRRIWDALWYGKPVDAGMIKSFPLDRHFRNALVTPVPADMERLWPGPELVALRGSWTDPRATYVGLKATGGLMGHDQCDAGTFVVDALGQAWAEEQGNPGYAQQRPRPRRSYEYYGKKEDQPLYRTEGQNTLLFNSDTYVGQERNVRCPVVSFHSSPARAEAVVDLTAAYTRDARRVLRGLALVDRRWVLVQDEFEAKKPTRVLWTLHTRASIELAPDSTTAILSKGRERLRAEILAPEVAAFEVLGPGPLPSSPSTDEGTRIHKDMRKLVVRLENAERGRIAVRLVPLEPGQPPPPCTLTPLEAW